MEKSFHCLITLMAIASLALAAATNQEDSPKKKGMCTYVTIRVRIKNEYLNPYTSLKNYDPNGWFSFTLGSL